MTDPDARAFAALVVVAAILVLSGIALMVWWRNT